MAVRFQATFRASTIYLRFCDVKSEFFILNIPEALAISLGASVQGVAQLLLVSGTSQWLYQAAANKMACSN